MARIPIRRAFEHVAITLDKKDAARQNLDAYWSGISPVVDVYGNARVAEMQYADVNGALGGVEATHTQVPEGFNRHYFAMQFSHDDAVARFLAPVIIVGTPTGFPAVALDDAQSVVSGQLRAIRNVVVPENGFIGARISVIGAGARIILRVVFVDMPIGEYIQGAGG